MKKILKKFDLLSESIRSQKMKRFLGFSTTGNTTFVRKLFKLQLFATFSCYVQYTFRKQSAELNCKLLELSSVQSAPVEPSIQSTEKCGGMVEIAVVEILVKAPELGSMSVATCLGLKTTTFKRT